LLDILRLAARAGLTVDEDSVLGALREGKAVRDAERAVENSSARTGLKVMNEADDVPAAATADAEGVGGLRRALGSDPT
jgi:hypothetical protein